jgi:hypothetical protein
MIPRAPRAIPKQRIYSDFAPIRPVRHSGFTAAPGTLHASTAPPSLEWKRGG